MIFICVFLICHKMDLGFYLFLLSLINSFWFQINRVFKIQYRYVFDEMNLKKNLLEVFSIYPLVLQIKKILFIPIMIGQTSITISNCTPIGRISYSSNL